MPRRLEVGDRVGLIREGQIIDRGEVSDVTETREGGRAETIKWQRTRFPHMEQGDVIRVLHTAETLVNFLDLEAAGVTEAEFRQGAERRRADHPWPISDAHREQLRPWLEARGFDVDSSEPIEAQESHDRDGFTLRQESPLP